MRTAILYNEPVLASDDRDRASEAGVLDAVAGVEAALAKAGHATFRVGLRGGFAEVAERLAAASRPDLVFNLCEGLDGSSAAEAYVTGALAMAGLAYTGSPPEALALARDKARTKWLLLGAGLPTPRFALVRRGSEPARQEIAALVAAGPVIVKPAAEDASLGIGPGSVATELEAALELAASVGARYGDVLIEAFVPGRELNVAIVALPTARVLAISEIEFLGDEGSPWHVLHYEAKWDPASRASIATPPRCPAKLEAALAAEVARVALAAFELVGCRDYARIDLRLDAAGRPFILEVNTNPDIGPDTGLARSAAADGLSYDGLVAAVAAEAWRRGTGAAHSAPDAPPDATASRVGAVTLGELEPGLVPQLVDIVRACGLFRDDEVAVADEVLSEAARAGAGGHYQVMLARRAGAVCGWSCHGRVPMTDASFDLYWIAVHPSAQGAGVGRRLLEAVEASVRAAAGRWLIAETSTTSSYAPTRGFYVRCGYGEVGRVDDFYRPGDGRVTFGKRLDRAG